MAEFSGREVNLGPSEKKRSEEKSLNLQIVGNQWKGQEKEEKKKEQLRVPRIPLGVQVDCTPEP